VSCLGNELEEQEVYQLPHFDSPELESCYICETAPFAGRKSSPSAPKIHNHTHEELASIRLVLRKLTSLRVANEQDAEDLVQDTLLTMTEKYPEGELEKSLLIWSMGILRKKVGNYYRKTRPYARISGASVKVRRWNRGHWATHSPESDLRHGELHLLVQHLIAEFPLPERRVLELRMAGLETHEIVLRLRPESYQNVVNRIYRGRRRLARELVKHGYANLLEGTS
jgi:RNA polymerase sigma factor (sigma-70 family)